MNKPAENQFTPKKWRTALVLNALVFPGLGYFFVGRKARGLLITLATCYFIFLPLIRFTHTLYTLMSPSSTAYILNPRIFNALSLTFSVHRELIIWSLIGILTLWLVGIVDVWSKIRAQNKMKGA